MRRPWPEGGCERGRGGRVRIQGLVRDCGGCNWLVKN